MRLPPPFAVDAPALDFTSERARLPGPPGPVDIVIPVYGAAAEFTVCLASVVASTDLSTHRLVVVLDGPGQDEAKSVLETTMARDTVMVLENAERLGYVGSVNHGMRESRRDVVLLNSDTRVTRGWLEQLRAAAYSSPAIATATPFSNNGTICSLPRPMAENDIPAGHDVDSFAELVAGCAQRAYPRMPNGVGFCLFVKRAALDAVGAFDQAAYGLGYGEEVDFCLRALRAGYVHVLDDATFVYHAGGRSFGANREALLQDGIRLVFERHPDYWATLKAFLRRDPLGPARRRVLDALAAQSGGRGGPAAGA